MALAYSIDELNCHLDYEILMLNASYSLMPITRSLVEGDRKSEINVVFRNAMIEVFCLHARNIEEFLRKKGSNTAHGQSNGRYVSKSPISRALMRKINNHAAHLTNGRTSDLRLRLGDKDWQAIVEWLRRELALFKEAMNGSGLRIRDVTVAGSPTERVGEVQP